MVTILWILLAYGSYQIGWQLQLQDPDPKLSDTLQRKCCKWQHLIVFAYLLLFRWAEICQSEQRDVMQITQAYMIGSCFGSMDRSLHTAYSGYGLCTRISRWNRMAYLFQSRRGYCNKFAYLCCYTNVYIPALIRADLIAWHIYCVPCIWPDVVRI